MRFLPFALLLVLTASCAAQSPLLDTHWGNATNYRQDLGNHLDLFAGNWMGVNGDYTISLQLVKGLEQCSSAYPGRCNDYVTGVITTVEQSTNTTVTLGSLQVPPPGSSNRNALNLSSLRSQVNSTHMAKATCTGCEIGPSLAGSLVTGTTTSQTFQGTVDVPISVTVRLVPYLENGIYKLSLYVNNQHDNQYDTPWNLPTGYYQLTRQP